MKLLNRQQFLNMPSGTLFSPYIDYELNLHIKGQTQGGSFYSQPLVNIKAAKSCVEAYRDFVDSGFCELNFGDQRLDSYQDEDQLFAVFHETELSTLAQIVNTALRLTLLTEQNNDPITP